MIVKCCVGSAFGSSLALTATYGTLYFQKKHAEIYTCLLGNSLLSLLASDRAYEDFGLLNGITALSLGVVVHVPEHHFAIPAGIAITFSLRLFIPLLGKKEDPAFSKENMAFGRLGY
ncbi:hypothetical protein Adt_24800 [Abeliophyllum distichum]|uniref:Uncharacterized protein n=1 Tax=Abeliophyllum distichum TaxID=126358 RepID=A0ABD1SEZ3_9LAMI